jgi:NitT/TauT family transport system permease protein
MSESTITDSDPQAIAPKEDTSGSRSSVTRDLPKWLINTLRVGLLIVVLGTLEIAVNTGLVSGLVLPSASAVGERLFNDIVSILSGGSMRRHFLTTAAQIYMAFGIVMVGGVLFGVLIHESKLVNQVIYPYVVTFAAMPRVAIAPLVLIWFGFGMTSKVVIGVMIALFPTLVATIAGLNATDNAKLQLMRSLGATQLETFVKVRFREALPYIFAGLQTSVVTVGIGVVVGEFAGGRQGLGVLITVYQDSLDVAGSLSAIILLSFIGLLNYGVMQYARKRIVFWVGEKKPS